MPVQIFTDEDIYSELRRSLRSIGYDIVSPSGLGLKGAADDEWLAYAADAGRTIITHNQDDYFLLHRAWRNWAERWQVSPVPRHSGILVVPQRDILATDTSARAIDRLLTSHTSLDNSFFRLRRNGNWERRVVYLRT